MPPRTRKPVPATEKVEVAVTEETPVDVAEQPVKRGRAANPVTGPLRHFNAAKKRLARAQKAFDKASDVVAELEAAKAHYAETETALDAAYVALKA